MKILQSHRRLKPLTQKVHISRTGPVTHTANDETNIQNEKQKINNVFCVKLVNLDPEPLESLVLVLVFNMRKIKSEPPAPEASLVYCCV